jgi:hypothetical protein
MNVLTFLSRAALVAWFLCLTCYAQVKSPIGIVFMKTYAQQGDEFATAMEFSEWSEHPVVINAREASTNKVQVVQKSLVAGVVTYLNPTTGIWLQPRHFEELKKWRTDTAQLKARFPKGAAALDAQLAVADQILAIGEFGDGWYKGRRMTKQEIAALSRAPNTAGTVPELKIGTTSYRDVRLSSVRETSIGIVHAGGIASVALAQLTADQIAALNNTSPTLKILPPGATPAPAAPSASPPASATVSAPGVSEGMSTPQPTSTIVTEQKGAATLAEVIARIKRIANERMDTIRTEAATKAKADVEKAQQVATESAKKADELAAKLRQQTDLPSSKTLEAAKKLDFVITQKLKGEKWTALQKYGGEAYEIHLPQLQKNLAILVCSFTTYESAGRGRIWTTKEGEEKVEKGDGFDATVPVYVEIDPKQSDKLDALSEQLSEITQLRDVAASAVKAVTEQADAEVKAAEAECKEVTQSADERIAAYELLETRLNWLYQRPAPRLSQYLTNMGFRAEFKDAQLTQIMEAFHTKDFQQLTTLVLGEQARSLNKQMAKEVAEELEEEDFNLLISSPSVKFGLNSTALPDAEQSSIAMLRVARAIVDVEHQRTPSASDQVEQIYSVDRHPDGIGLIYKAPLRGELFAFRDLDSRMSKLVHEATRTLSKDLDQNETRQSLGEADANSGRQILATWRANFIRTLERLLTEY